MRSITSCAGCEGYCCSETGYLPLTTEDADFLALGGTVLTELLPPIEGHRWRIGDVDPSHEMSQSKSFGLYKRTKLAAGEGLFRRDGACAYLDQVTKRCTVYHDPARPRACRDFPVGGFACELAVDRGRQAAGAVPIALTIKPPIELIEPLIA